MPDSGCVTPEASQAPAKILLGKYEVGRLLGVGAFAKVYHARHVPSGQNVAIKVISKAKVFRGDLVPRTKREIAIMRRLHHPHIVRLLEVLASRSKIYFVMEYAKGGELFALIARGRLPEEHSRRFFHQLVSAVAFCHSRGVFHRDLKPENLLLDDSGELKVSDFGLSAITADQIRADGLLHTICGTPAYVAPEILSKKGYDGAKVDIWSCGVILFVLHAGYLPFNDPNLMEMYRKIYRGEYRCPKWTSPDLRRLLSRLLDTNPATRIGIDGILRDPWFRRGLDEAKMKRLLTFHEDVENRITNIESGIDEEEDRDLNAFDIISLSSGFDLSGLFDKEAAPRHRFLSSEAVDAVLNRLEMVGIEEGLVVRRRRTGSNRRGCAVVEGKTGSIIAWVEIFRLSPGLVVVEVEKGGGEEAGPWNANFWKEKLGIGLKESASEPSTPVCAASTSGESSTGKRIGPSSEPPSPVSLTEKRTATESAYTIPV